MQLANIIVYSNTGSDSPPFTTTSRLGDVLLGQRSLIIGASAAFLQSSEAQLQDYEDNYDAIRDLDIDEIYCICNNDYGVVDAWKTHMNISKVKMIADGNNSFATEMNLKWNAQSVGYGIRMKRFAAVANDLQIETLSQESPSVNDPESDPYIASTSSMLINWLERNRRPSGL